MRGTPQVIAGHLPRAVPSRPWRTRVTHVIQARRRIRIDRLVIAERRAREERHARQRGLYVPEVKYRVRPW